MKHIAVVPVFGEDSRGLLDHAARLAPEVIAVGFNGARPMLDVPLVVLDTRERSWNQSIEHVIEVLRRNEGPARITLVVPASIANVFAESAIEVAAV